ncbi:hypothetical protein SAMN04515617_102240 [Collimonas sp. OK242]|uniref:hypothetical protein n=1 Tax=Collimonas sp. OK242 TaxID=1798195 RepID=UPI0008997C23|nr:hypothetical protein [Collimonas sp. OK242]SDX26621.1 hypothetical protein SAMN04515617_102240 [Collimonas sp. OK242]
MFTEMKHHHLRDYWTAHSDGMGNWQKVLKFFVTLIAVCLAIVIFFDVNTLLTDLLRWIGSDCVWCAVVPS